MKGSNSKQNKSVNLRLVLSQVVTHGPVSRADIARATHLTKQTITNLIDELLATQLVIETGIKKEKVGKPSTMLMLNTELCFSLAIRVFPQQVEVALCQLDGTVLGNIRQQVESTQAETVQQLVATLLAQYQINREQLLGAGLTLVQFGDVAVEQRQQQNQLLQQQLIGLLQLPVAIEHTAAACAAFHLLHGEAKLLDSFCYIHLGQQLDAALVYDRKLLLGHNGLTGALGEIFVTSDLDEKTAELGRLNDYVSVASLENFIRKKQPQLVTQSLLTINADCAADKLDPWFARSTEPMRIAIHTLESIFNCQTIIIGGEVSSWFLDKLISRLRPFIPSVAQFGKREVPRLIKTPDVELIALKGLGTLPLHAAIRLDATNTIGLPAISVLTPLQQLIFSDPDQTSPPAEDC
jgi:predicted NBD/HSP70 family sugar kinase